MLVLQGKKNDRFVIGDDVTVTIVLTEPGRVRLGFEAPKSIGVDREEVRRRKIAEGGYVPASVSRGDAPRWRDAALEAARMLQGPQNDDEANEPAARFWAMLEALGLDPQAIPEGGE